MNELYLTINETQTSFHKTIKLIIHHKQRNSNLISQHNEWIVPHKQRNTNLISQDNEWNIPHNQRNSNLISQHNKMNYTSQTTKLKPHFTTQSHELYLTINETQTSFHKTIKLIIPHKQRNSNLISQHNEWMKLNPHFTRQ